MAPRASSEVVELEAQLSHSIAVTHCGLETSNIATAARATPVWPQRRLVLWLFMYMCMAMAVVDVRAVM